MEESVDSIILGGGCFWCIEAIFQQLQGVTQVVSGYAGGEDKNPRYETIARSGHAEVIKISFNTATITLEEIMEIFFTIHDPTTIDRQGNDVGPQYRSIILYGDEKQKDIVERVIDRMNPIWDHRIVTEVKESNDFYPAENYHQNYYNENKNSNPYCTFVIQPKLEKFRKKYFDKLITQN
ncbi:MAG: peptide-methionine (S)-S-oxide reductase MsrA [Candidatus Heimdallarchaeota archaeon]|nr:peptide-methionine (S)-S-oxide reductase MsrA [Candidatus Heimdallarchaeota archaeon]